jgi:hypothetical protein
MNKPENHIAVVCARKGIDLSKHGRNEPCPCKSGKKFKKCCIKEAPEELCYRFSKASYLFDCANAEGEFEQARKHAEEHNYLLAVLRLLDPGTFREFENLEVVEV